MKLWLAALAIAGCIYESGGHREDTTGTGGVGGGGVGGAGGGAGDGGVAVGYIQLTWTVGDQATGMQIGCRTGETVLIQVANFVQNYPCPDMFERVGPIPVGTYSLRASLLDASRNVESAVPINNIVVQPNAITDAGNAFFLVPNMQTGVRFTWEIRIGNPMGPARACLPTEAVTFNFGGFGYTEPCSNFSAEMDGVPPGGYSVSPTLMNNGSPESTANGVNVFISTGMVTNGGHIVFITSM